MSRLLDSLAILVWAAGLAAQPAATTAPEVREVLRVPLPVSRVHAVAIAKGGTLGATADQRGMVRLLELEPLRQRLTIQAPFAARGATRLVFVDGDRLGVLGEGDAAVLYRTTDGARVDEGAGIAQRLRHEVARLAARGPRAPTDWPPTDVRAIAADASSERTLVLRSRGDAWSCPAGGASARCLNDWTANGRHLAFSADGDWLVVMRPTHRLLVHVPSGARHELPYAHAREAQGTLCSGGTGPEFVFADAEGVAVWNAALRREVRRLRLAAPGSPWRNPKRVAVAAAGSWLAAVLATGSVLVDLHDGTVRRAGDSGEAVAWSSAPVATVAAFARGRYLPDRSTPGDVECVPVHGEPWHIPLARAAASIAFVPGTAWLVAASSSDLVLLDGSAGVVMTTRRSDEHRVLALSPRLVATHDFEAITLRRVPDLAAMARLQPGGGIAAATAANDGRRIAVILRKDLFLPQPRRDGAVEDDGRTGGVGRRPAMNWPPGTIQ